MILLLTIAACEPATEEPEEPGQVEERTVITSGTQYADLRLEKLVGDLEYPWSIAFLPEGRKLVTESSGRLNILQDGEITEVDGVPEVHFTSQGGLMEVEVHPQFEENQWIYLTYSKPDEDEETATALYRARLDGYSLVDGEDIFIQNRYSDPGRHYGSRLVWLDDGTLLMSIGDRGGDPPRAQDTQDHAGTVVRLHDDGSVPADNPFVGDPDVLDEIYAYGLRNIQGMVVDPENGNVWATKHGPRGGDELNLIEPGNNYGWPVVTLGWSYGDQSQFEHAEGRWIENFTEPVYEITPSPFAPSGLTIVTTDRFASQWEGNLLAGALRGEQIRRFVIGEYGGRYEVFHDELLYPEAIGRIRDLEEGPDGNIYITTDHSDGGVYRMSPDE